MPTESSRAGRNPSRRVRGRLWWVLGLAVLLTAAAIGEPNPKREKRAKSPAAGSTADDLLIVDCLLPGQVRRLGRQATYVTPRRPIRTSTLDCEIRGGEYVQSDRSSYKDALKVWLAAAETGDAQAQNYVGEIFEKGLGVPSDPGAAAVWYRKAADQGSSAAQINLGYLYEKGLGVELNPTEALNWYRKAAGLPDAIALEPAAGGADAAEVQSLRDKVERLQKEGTELRQRLEELQGRLEQYEGELDSARTQERRLQDELAERRRELDAKRREQGASEAAEAEEVARLEDELARRSRELTEQQNKIAGLESEVAASRKKLTDASALRDEVAEQKRLAEELRTQLDEARRQLAETSPRLEQKRQAAQQLENELEAARAELEERRRQLSSSAEAAQKVAALEGALSEREKELAEQQTAIQRLEETSAQYQARVQELESTSQQSFRGKGGPPVEVAVASGDIAGPTIELIDPPLVRTRGPMEVVTREGVTERQLIGRVSAPAGLMTFLVNEQPQPLEANGLFKVTVPVLQSHPVVTLAAIDDQGKRTAMEFSLRAPGTAAPQAAQAPAAPVLPQVDFGKFHALVIGNNDYRHLSNLESAVNDATEISSLLEEKYGFTTRLLLNATRHQLLTALNELREELTGRDNLLIYYAGHGQFDAEIQRGYWQPVDAEESNTANWISILTITDYLQIISAKQILVIADSCYSGALTRSSVARLQAGMTPEAHADWMKKMARKRARIAFTSGGLKPVMDAGGGNHSVFARALLDVLNENAGILETQRLYREVSARVTYAASASLTEQTPEYAPIKFSGHESGDFFFVPKSPAVASGTATGR